MAYNNYTPPDQQQTSFNAELFHRQATLECLLDYLRLKQTKDYSGMLEILGSVVDHNIAEIDVEEIDKQIKWLQENIDKAFVKDEEGKIIRINFPNKTQIDTAFQKAHRTIMRELFRVNIIRKPKQDPKIAMSQFDN